MANKIIANEMSSSLDLSAIKDVHGNAVTLRPRGMSGSTREVHGDAAEHEVVKRVLSLQWISIKPVGVMEPAAAEPVKAALVAEPVKAAPVVEAVKADVSDEPTKADEPKADESQAKRKR